MNLSKVSQHVQILQLKLSEVHNMNFISLMYYWELFQFSIAEWNNQLRTFLSMRCLHRHYLPYCHSLPDSLGFLWLNVIFCKLLTTLKIIMEFPINAWKSAHKILHLQFNFVSGLPYCSSLLWDKSSRLLRWGGETLSVESTGLLQTLQILFKFKIMVKYMLVNFLTQVVCGMSQICIAR